MPAHPPAAGALTFYKQLLIRLSEAPAWRLKPVRSAPEGNAHDGVPSTRVFAGNAVVDRVWRRLLNKAECELSQLRERALLAAKARRGGSRPSRDVAVEASALELALRPLLLAAVGGAARFFMRGLNTTTVSGQHQFEQAVLARAPGQGLLTVSNHVGALDDPLVLSAALPAALLVAPSAMRWTLCATDRCFVHPLADAFFRAGKVLPLARGGGLAQPGLAAAEARLAAGNWVHLFPEGTRSQTGAMGPVRIGVGRLYAAALAAAPAGTPPPLVLPFVHAGMEEVNPAGRASLGVGRDVHVLFGEPLDLTVLVTQHAASGQPPEVLYAAVASQVEAALQALHAQLRPAAPPAAQLPTAPPARPSLASRMCDWANSPASRELGRHTWPAGFAASRAWGLAA